ncbi:UNVERIFIED_CONTAM: hypothetical protein FKN15_073347 [Acipenser sinensis]
MGEAIITQAWIRRHNPDTLEVKVKLAENFEDSMISSKTGLPTAPSPRSSRGPAPLPTPPLPVTSQTTDPNGQPYLPTMEAKKSGVQMGEAIITQAWIRRHNPDTLEVKVKLAENFEDSMISSKTGLPTAPSPRSSRGPAPLPTPPLPVTSQTTDPNGQPYLPTMEAKVPTVRTHRPVMPMATCYLALEAGSSVPRTGWFGNSFQRKVEVGQLKRGRSHSTPSHRPGWEAMWQSRIGGKAIALANQGGVAEDTKRDVVPAPCVSKHTAPLASLEGAEALGLAQFPPVDSTIATLMRAPPLGLAKDPVCPNDQCRIKEAHLKMAYAAEVQARVLDADKSAPGHTFRSAVEEILQHSHRGREASGQMLPSCAPVRDRPLRQPIPRAIHKNREAPDVGPQHISDLRSSFQGNTPDICPGIAMNTDDNHQLK